jgi:carbon-monoxide dehydrogenase large subunit
MAGEPAPGFDARRREDPPLLTGRGLFVADVARRGTLEACFVRSPHAHATIRAVDPGPAVAEGALLVLTAAELPFGDRALLPRRWHPAIRGGTPPPLARERVRYVGEPLALVVAADGYRARDLAERVRVVYAGAPAVVTPEAAREPGAPRIHETWAGNVAARLEQRVGDAAAALLAAPRRLRHRFRFPRQLPVPLEPRGCLAEPGTPAGGLTLWDSTQVTYHTRANLAALLDLPEALVRVVAPDVGGGFGAKSRTYWEEILVAHAAMRLGRPVRWIEGRLEHLTATTHSRDATVDLEVGYDRDGRLRAARCRAVVDVGAYVHGNGVITAEVLAAQLPGAYRLPDYDAEVLCVGTHKTPLATYRGTGQPEATLAMERMLDLIAKDLGLDPVGVRMRNLLHPAELPYRPGTVLAGAPVVLESGDFPAVLARAVELARERPPVALGPDEALGVGWALGLEVTGLGGPESARVRVGGDGRVEVSSGLTTQGQGQATTLARVCGEVLGVEPDAVAVRLGDTALLPTGKGSFASRGAVVGASAVAEAAARVRQRAVAEAARLLEASPGDLMSQGGRIHPRGSPARGVTLGEVVQGLGAAGVALEAEVLFAPAALGGTYALSAHVATVAVDRLTGACRVLDYAVVHDVGRRLHEAIVDGQVHGGVVEGLAGALLAEMVYDAEGQPLTGSLMDYPLASAALGPPIRIAHLEIRPATNPCGVRGVGEGGTIPVAAAVANAVSRALGEHLHGGEALLCTLPLTPERILRALAAARAPAAG